MLNLNNAEKKKKSFMYQNLQKSKCYNTDFSQSTFDYVCLRGAHMKSCSFNECSFKETEFIGTNLKDSNFKNATFDHAVFEGAKLEGVDFKGAKFIKTIFVGSNLEKTMNLNIEDPNVTIYNEMPAIDISNELQVALEKLMQNTFVKKSRVLDTKDKKLNTVSVMILLDQFEEKTLIKTFETIESHLDRDFYTLSYIIKLMKKLN